MLACAHVESADVAGCAQCGRFLHTAAGHYHVSQYRWRRGKAKKGIWRSVEYVLRLQVRYPVDAEIPDRLARRGIERDQVSAASRNDDAGFLAAAARPISHAPGRRRVRAHEIIGP